MSERELFEDAYRKVQLMEHDGDTFEQYPNGNYVRFSLNLAWLMWQASANRQGYKLVPVEPTQEMVESGCKNITYNTDDVVPIYKAMIGAVG